jgi:hypothetical protein
VALGIVAFLSTLDGVVFVAESWRHSEWHTHHYLTRLLHELRGAGLDVERLPFVFQCNGRDCADVLPFEQMAATLSTRRPTHVESIASVGYGVKRALDSLVALIDHGASQPLPPPSSPGITPARVVATPSSPRGLFEEWARDLTGDGEVGAVLHVSTHESGIALDRGSITWAWPKAPARVRAFALGDYAIEIVERGVFLHEHTGWRVVRSQVIAARIRRRNVPVSVTSS